MCQSVFVAVLLSCLVAGGTLATEPPSVTAQPPTTPLPEPSKGPPYFNCTAKLMDSYICIAAGQRAVGERLFWETTTETKGYTISKGKYTHVTTLSVPAGYVINYLYVDNLFNPPLALLTMIDGGPSHPYVTLSMESDRKGKLGFQTQIYIVKVTPDQVE